MKCEYTVIAAHDGVRLYCNFCGWGHYWMEPEVNLLDVLAQKGVHDFDGHLEVFDTATTEINGSTLVVNVLQAANTGRTG